MIQRREPLFATPCYNTSRTTWSTPSKPPHKKPFFEVLWFSALFGSGCCCQLVCFEFGVLRFRLPLYTRNGQVGEHVLLLWFLALDLAGCCCQLVCFECCASFPFAYTRNGQIVGHVRTEKKQKRPCPAVQGTWLHVGPFLAGVLTQRFSTQPLELYVPRLSRCTAQEVVSCSEYRRRKPQNTSPGVHAHRFECGYNKTGCGGCSEGLGAF